MQDLGLDLDFFEFVAQLLYGILITIFDILFVSIPSLIPLFEAGITSLVFSVLSVGFGMLFALLLVITAYRIKEQYVD